MEKTITTKADLEEFYTTLPEGTLANRTGEDLETGNFDDAQFVLPNGDDVTVIYTGE